VLNVQTDCLILNGSAKSWRVSIKNSVKPV
jgi:hypothetical protein